MKDKVWKGEETRERRRKGLRYHSCERDSKELDLLMGQFAAKHLAEMTEAELDLYEAIVNENEHDIYAWLAGREAPPPEHDNHIMKMILNFRITP